MKTRTITLMVALLLVAGRAKAQGGIPVTYLRSFELDGFLNNHEGIGLRSVYDLFLVGDNVILGKMDQEIGIVAPGAKKVICECRIGGNRYKTEHELYPNGLLKNANSEGQDQYHHTYNYDKQWRLQNVIDQDGKVAYKYFYDQQHRLSKCVALNIGEYNYTYTTDNQLSQIVDPYGDELWKVAYKYKNKQLIEIAPWGKSMALPKTFTYDEQGRWKSFTNIWEDGMDDIYTFKDQLTYNYNGASRFPSSMTWRTGEYNPARKTYVGDTQTTTFTCTYTLDAKGNWTTWKLTGNGKTVIITRTITYYTDEEVRAAVAELEKARTGATPNGQKEEGLWEF